MTVSADSLISGLTPAEAVDYLSLLADLEQLQGNTNMSQYADDPVGFIEKELHCSLTPDLISLCEAVVKYPVVIAKSGNGTGKSYILARLALWFFCCRTRPKVFLAAAPPEENLESILWSELTTACDQTPDIVADSKQKYLKIRRTPDEFIAGVKIPKTGTDAQRQASFSGKHAPSLLMGFDEGDAIPKPIYTGAETCLSGGFARMVIIYNPRERLGYVYQMVKDGRAYVVTLTAFNHPNVITGRDIIPGAVNREITLTRIAQMSRPLAPDEKPDKFCYLLPDFLVGCIPKDQKDQPLPPLVPGWYRITDHSFSHIVLGEYPAQADNQLISEEWLDAARSRYDLFTAKYGVIVPEHVRCTAGLDIAEMGEDTTVLYKRFGNFVHPPRQWAKHDVIEVAGLVADDLQGISLAAINCDGNGIGAGVAPYLVMAYNFPAVGIKGHSAASDDSKGQFKSIDDQMMWEMREWLRTDLAMLPPRSELLEELLCYSFERKGGKIIVSNSDKVKEKLGRSPDDAMGLKFTFAPRGMFADSDLS